MTNTAVWLAAGWQISKIDGYKRNVLLYNATAALLLLLLLL
jgi:hypothetical protein